ncbi:MAG TPA: hypothetical protein VGN95_17980 [Pyrinomonadaceae bacterium]|jgi:hypothetical protein|nr:hypothetical protein [Pyrinomonadaceae bacterium]
MLGLRGYRAAHAPFNSGVVLHQLFCKGDEEMRTRKFAMTLTMLAAICASYSISSSGQNLARIERGKLSELKGRRIVYVTATDSHLLNNLARLVKKEDIFQFSKDRQQAEIMFEGIRGADSGYGDEVMPISTTLQVSYRREDGVKVIVWTETIKTNVQLKTSGASLLLYSTQDEVILMKRFVNAFKREAS